MDLKKFREEVLEMASTRFAEVIGVDPSTVHRAEKVGHRRNLFYTYVYLGTYCPSRIVPTSEGLISFREDSLGISSEEISRLLGVDHSTILRIEARDSGTLLLTYSLAYLGILLDTIVPVFTGGITSVVHRVGQGLIRFGGSSIHICELCSRQKPCHRHHVIPRSLGGWDGRDNKVYLCVECHSWLHSRGPKPSVLKFTKREAWVYLILVKLPEMYVLVGSDFTAIAAICVGRLGLNGRVGLLAS